MRALSRHSAELAISCIWQWPIVEHGSSKQKLANLGANYKIDFLATAVSDYLLGGYMHTAHACQEILTSTRKSISHSSVCRCDGKRRNRRMSKMKEMKRENRAAQYTLFLVHMANLPNSIQVSLLTGFEAHCATRQLWLQVIVKWW